MKKRMRLSLLQKCGFLLPLLLVAHGAHASNATDIGNVIDVFNPQAVSQGTDKSLLLLGDIFGSVDGVLHGFGSQVLGAMFAVYNAVVMALGGLVLLYTLIVGCLNTAQQGQPMGQKWGNMSMWIIIRMALGMALLIPKASGYCLIQIFVMWCVVQGVGGADTMWNHTVNYISKAGTFMSAGINSDDVGKTIDAANTVLQMQTCLYSAKRAYDDQHKTMIGVHRHLNFEPSYPKRVKESGQYFYRSDFPAASLLPRAMCGSISWPAAPSAATESLANKINAARLSANWQLIQDMQSYAHSYIDNAYADGSYHSNLVPPAKKLSNDDRQDAANAVKNAVLDYIAIIDPAVVASNQKVQSKAFKDIEDSQKDGWILAGSYYANLTALNGKKSAVGDNKSLGTSTFKNSQSGQLNPQIEKNIKKFFNSKDAATQIIANLNYGGYLSDIHDRAVDLFSKGDQSSSGISSSRFNKNMQRTKTAGKLILAGMVTSSPAGVAAVTPVIIGLGKIIDKWQSLFVNPDPNHPVDPIMGLNTFGTTIINWVVIWWLVGAATFYFIGLGMGVGTCMSPLFWGLQAFMMWFIPMFITICTLLFTSGCVMAYYVPMIPYLIFLFGALGWFMGVIESMVAAPLVALGIAHPEGHEAYGRAEPAVMLIVNIFVRPSLMIIGFITAILLSYVGLKLLNLGMGRAVDTAMGGDHGLSSIFFIVAVIVVYTGTVVVIINKSYSLINDVPNKVLRWIGGADQLGDGSVDLSSIQGSVSTAASQTGQATGQGLEGSKKRGQEDVGESKKKAAEEKKAGGIDNLGGGRIGQGLASGGLSSAYGAAKESLRGNLTQGEAQEDPDANND